MPGGFLDAFGFPFAGGGGGGGGGTGDVVGPASATDNALARFDLATGKLIQNSTALLSDAGELALTSTGAAADAMRVIANSLTSGNGLYLSSSSTNALTRALMRLDNTGIGSNTRALEIHQTSASPAIFVNNNTGSGLVFNDSQNQTQHTISVYGDQFTSGSILRLHDDSSSGVARNVAHIIVDQPTAALATGLSIQHDGGGTGVLLNTATGRALDIASSATTQRAVSVVADGLGLGGRGLYVYSNSADVQARALVEFHNDNPLATGATAIAISQDAAAIALSIAQNANGVGLDLQAATQSTNAVNLVASSLTTGSALYVYSDSADITTRSLAQFFNDNALATGARPVFIRQDSTGEGLRVLMNGNGGAVVIAAPGITTATALDLDVPAATTGMGLQVTANAMTTGRALRVYSDSAVSTGVLAEIVNDNTASTASALRIQQDGSSGVGLDIVSTALLANPLQVTGNSITSADVALFRSSSGNTNTRSIVNVINSNVLATGVSALRIQQDSTGAAIVIAGAASAPASSTTETRFGDRIFRFRQSVGDEVSAGSIAYRTFGAGLDALDLVGAGTTSANRLVQIFDALQMREVAAIPGGAPAATFGKVWIKDNIPNTLMYTDDAGQPFALSPVYAFQGATASPTLIGPAVFTAFNVTGCTFTISLPGVYVINYSARVLVLAGEYCVVRIGVTATLGVFLAQSESIVAAPAGLANQGQCSGFAQVTITAPTIFRLEAFSNLGTANVYSDTNGRTNMTYNQI